LEMRQPSLGTLGNLFSATQLMMDNVFFKK
jgi:hypothetical protein